MLYLFIGIGFYLFIGACEAANQIRYNPIGQKLKLWATFYVYLDYGIRNILIVTLWLPIVLFQIIVIPFWQLLSWITFQIKKGEGKLIAGIKRLVLRLL